MKRFEDREYEGAISVSWFFKSERQAEPPRKKKEPRPDVTERLHRYLKKLDR